MTTSAIENAIINGKGINNPITKLRLDDVNKGGYYSIWLSDKGKVQTDFQNEIIKRNSKLLYIGIATKSLHKRLYEQELQHTNAATFFRSIGAVLGYRPEKGSLSDKKNQNNYRFSLQDTKDIIQWIDGNLEVKYHFSEIEIGLEKKIITKYTPLLNWTYNPLKFIPLKLIKQECRIIARGL